MTKIAESTTRSEGRSQIQKCPQNLVLLRIWETKFKIDLETKDKEWNSFIMLETQRIFVLVNSSICFATNIPRSQVTFLVHVFSALTICLVKLMLLEYHVKKKDEENLDEIDEEKAEEIEIDSEPVPYYRKLKIRPSMYSHINNLLFEMRSKVNLLTEDGKHRSTENGVEIEFNAYACYTFPNKHSQHPEQ